MFEETFPLEFGPYQLLEKIGQGGMAEIFRAESYGSQGFVKEIAIKRILSSLGSNQDFVTQFLDEARIAGSLSHPNIVQIYDVGQVNEAYYIAMEFVNGKHLGQVIRSAIEKKHAVPIEVAVLITKEVAQALSFAHSAVDASGQAMNIVHRDISPQNILVDYHGAIKLTDFGIAKAANKLFQTTAGVIKGKFSYLAPEQLVGQGASGASDLFSLGVVFWETLSGRRLFQGESDIKTIQLVQACDIPQLAQFRRDIPTELVEIVGKLLSANPQYRYQDASLLVRDLSYFLTNNGISEGPSKIANFMGSLYPDKVRSSGVAPTKASLPAISMDELEAYVSSGDQEYIADDQTSTQDNLSSFEDAKTPVATEAELTNPHQDAWPEATKRPAPADSFDDDIQTAAIDMSPLLSPQAFERNEQMETAALDASGIDTSGVDLSLLEKVSEASEGGMEETAALEDHEETVSSEEDPEIGLEGDEGPPHDEADTSESASAEDSPDAPTRPAKPSPKGKSNRTFAIIVVVLVLISGGVWGTYFALSQQKRKPLKAQPAPVTSATLEVEIDPPQAKVTINGLVMSGSPNVRKQAGLVGGIKYRVHASLKGYKAVRMPVTLEGKVSRITIKLQKQ